MVERERSWKCEVEGYGRVQVVEGGEPLWSWPGEAAEQRDLADSAAVPVPQLLWWRGYCLAERRGCVSQPTCLPYSITNYLFLSVCAQRWQSARLRVVAIGEQRLDFPLASRWQLMQRS